MAKKPPANEAVLTLDWPKIKGWLAWLSNTPWHPLLIASWFMLFPYIHNRNDLTANVVIKPLEIAWLFSLLFVGLSWLVYRSWIKAAISATTLVVITLGFGYIADFVHRPHLTWLSSNKFLLLLLLLIFGYIAWRTYRVKADKDLNGATKYLNLAGLVLVIFNLVPLIFSSSAHIKLNEVDSNKVVDLDRSKLDPSTTPDVYYIVPEDYAGGSILKAYFKYDNSPFYNFLKSRGFSVNPNALPNYAYSPPSIASTLNQRYLDSEVKLYRDKTVSVVPYYSLMEDNLTVRTFKSIGYKYVHIGSWWGPTAKSKLADISFTPPTRYIIFNHSYVPTEFERTLVNSSIGRIFLKHPLKLNKLTIFKSESATTGNRAQTLFNQVAFLKQKVVSLKAPKFVFMHVMSPHRPFVFNADCSTKPEENVDSVNFAKHKYTSEYDKQLACTDSQLETVVNTILDNSSQPPIIIIQSDEGEYPTEYWLGQLSKKNYDWYKAPDSVLHLKFETLSAFYLPGGADKDLKRAAFINTFRYILNRYFGGQLDLLVQKNYISDEHVSPYTFNDVTARL